MKLTDDQIRERLKKHKARSKNIAESMGISKQNLCNILKNRAPVSKRVACFLLHEPVKKTYWEGKKRIDSK